jgi:hypothetical protein
MGVEHNGKYIFVAEYDHQQIAKSTIEIPKDLAEMKKALNNFIHSITAKTQQ